MEFDSHGPVAKMLLQSSGNKTDSGFDLSYWGELPESDHFDPHLFTISFQSCESRSDQDQARRRFHHSVRRNGAVSLVADLDAFVRFLIRPEERRAGLFPDPGAKYTHAPDDICCDTGL